MPEGATVNERLRQVIKRLLKAKGLTQADLARQMKVSPATVKRMLNTDDLSVNRLAEVGKILDVEFFELLRLAAEPEVSGSQLTEEQELFLADHPNHAYVYWRLINGCSPSTITEETGLSEADLETILTTLIELQMVDRRGERYHARIPWPIGFRFKGPLHERYSQRSVMEFVQSLWEKVELCDPNTDVNQRFGLRILQFVLRDETYDVMLRELRDIFKKFVGVSRLEQAVESDHRLKTFSFLLGVDQVDSIAQTFWRAHKAAK